MQIFLSRVCINHYAGLQVMPVAAVKINLLNSSHTFTVYSKPPVLKNLSLHQRDVTVQILLCVLPGVLVSRIDGVSVSVKAHTVWVLILTWVSSNPVHCCVSFFCCIHLPKRPW